LFGMATMLKCCMSGVVQGPYNIKVITPSHY
jgi:hypothetical protein